MEAADSFQRQSAYPREEPKCYSGGSHTREINLLFRITALVISMINTVVNVSRQNCDSLWFFSKGTRILMNPKQNYNGGRRGAINYSWTPWGGLMISPLFLYILKVIYTESEILYHQHHCEVLQKPPALWPFFALHPRARCLPKELARACCHPRDTSLTIARERRHTLRPNTLQDYSFTEVKHEEMKAK